MPARHSKNSGDRHHFTYHEKQRAGLGPTKQRLGTESQLPFGYCALSLYPAEDAVVSPSGHLYSRESILEYLLSKSKELKVLREQYEEQQERSRLEAVSREQERHQKEVEAFFGSNDLTGVIGKRKANELDTNIESQLRRRKLIDDTDREVRVEELKKVSPWIPQFTPVATESSIPEPPKRPPSPFSGRSLRAKDLIPVDLIKESSSASSGDSSVKFICPVSRKTITNQKVILLKNTGVIMIEQAYQELALPSMTCPITGKPFKSNDVLELARAASGFAATGNVEAKKDRPKLN